MFGNLFEKLLNNLVVQGSLIFARADSTIRAGSCVRSAVLGRSEVIAYVCAQNVCFIDRKVCQLMLQSS